MYKYILVLVFSIGILWSHYGTAYLVMVMLLFTIGILLLIKSKDKMIIDITLIYCVVVLAWYMFVSNSSMIESIISIGKTIIDTICTEFFVPEASRGFVALTTSPYSIWSLLQRILFLTIFFLICIGYLNCWKLLIKTKNIKNKILTYLIFSLYWVLIMGAALIIPFFAVMNPARLYPLAYITLIPFSIVGIKKLYTLSTIFRNNVFKEYHFLQMLFIIGILYLVLSTGFINEVTKIDPKSISLSKKSILKYGNIERKGDYYSFIIQSYDVYGVKWLSTKGDPNRKIYVTLGFLDTIGVFRPYGNIPHTRLCPIKQNSTYFFNDDTYIFLYTVNIKEKIGVDVDPYATHLIWYNITEIYAYHLLKNQSKIYDNGGCQVLWVS